MAKFLEIAYKCGVDLREKIEANIRERQLFERGAAVLIGVSGGVDSMVLLHLLQQLAPANDWSLAIAHLNHCLRGAESDADEAFVRAEAERLKTPVYFARSDVKKFAEENGISIEMAGRELRHRFLIETADRLNMDRIALAHHADDNIETFWLRLLRGEVGSGLSGIRWKRRIRAGSESQFVRPLLNIPKRDLMAFAEENGIKFRVDASNNDRAFLRNRLRLEVLPALGKFQPAIGAVTLRAVEVLTDEKAFLEAEAQRWLTDPKGLFAPLHVALQREIVRQQLAGIGLQPSFELIEELRLRPDRPVTFSPTQRVSRKESGHLLVETLSAPAFPTEQIAVDLNNSRKAEFGGLQFAWEFCEERGAEEPGVEYFDCGAVGTKIVLRYWAPGDRFRPSGLAGEAKIQDLFTNLKISAKEKRRRVVAVGQDGKVFWVEGLRISHPHKVTEITSQVLKWTWQRCDPISG